MQDWDGYTGEAIETQSLNIYENLWMEVNLPGGQSLDSNAFFGQLN